MVKATLRMEGVSQAYPAYLYTPPGLIVTYTMGEGGVVVR
jgi:hypothetical protein